MTKIKILTHNIRNNLPVVGLEIKTISKGAGIVFVGIIIGRGLKYIFEVTVAQNLGPELFGVFFLGFSIFRVLESITIFGLHDGVLRYVSLYRGEKDENRIKGIILLSVKIVLIVGIVITAILIIFSHAISERIFPGINLALILKIFAIGLVFTALTEILVYSTQAFQIMKYKVLVRMLFEPGLRIFLFFVFFLLGWKLLGAVFAFVVSVISGTFLAFYYMKRVFPSITKNIPHPIYETKNILSYSWPLFFVGFLNLIIIHISTLMLGHFTTPQIVGIYAAAQRTALLIPIILESFCAIFAPIISDLYNRKELKKLETLFNIITRWIFTISFPCVVVMVFFAKEILSIWGKEYTSGTVCLIVICCAQLINCSVGPAGIMIIMTGRTKIGLINSFIVVLMIITLNFFLIPKYSILGAALSLGIAVSLINILRLIEVYLILKIHPYRINFLKPLFSTGLSFLVLFMGSKYLLPTFHPLITLFVGCFSFIAVYTVILFLLGIEEEDKFILRKHSQRLNV